MLNCASDEQDYFDCSNMLSGLELPGLSNHDSEDEDSINAHSSYHFGNENYFKESFGGTHKLEALFY